MKKEELNDLKKEYPVGTRIELNYMDDVQAPPRGTKGTIIGIDSLGTIKVTWDNGSMLGVIPGLDSFIKIN